MKQNLISKIEKKCHSIMLSWHLLHGLWVYSGQRPLPVENFMGTKTILNEFIAFIHLANLSEDALSPRSRVIISYAMCGFANPGSFGIMIGGLCAIAPNRRDEIFSLGLRAVIAGAITTCMTGLLQACLLKGYSVLATLH